MFDIDDDLREFVESGVSVHIGANGAGPKVSRAWGPRVAPGNHAVDVFVETIAAADVIKALRHDGRVACVLASPTTYRSIQLKGRAFEFAHPAPDDRDWVQRHRERFTTAVALVGVSPTVVRNQWTETGILRVRFSVDEVYDQTPGAAAGSPL